MGSIISKDNWFHSRDFIFLCRMLRKVAHTTSEVLFDETMMLRSLRRHFQSLDPALFPLLALHFLDHCGLVAPAGDQLDARVVASLRDALQDAEGGATADPTLTHSRYILVVDPTDCEVSVDVLLASLLDKCDTKIIALSDFPLDGSPTIITAVLAQIKRCIERGDTLLLQNSAPLQSALVSVY